MDKIIFFTTLVLFPFGQLFKFGIVNLFDVSVFILAIITLTKKPKYPEWYRYFLYFILYSLFSLIVNYQMFTINGLLYLVRFWSYSMIAIYISNLTKFKSSILNFLLLVSVVCSVFGWLQYLIWPDLTSLKYLGWDDHLLRMIGTFLDPTFLGLIFVLGIIVSSEKFPRIMYFLLFSLAFTYSRASYFIASFFLVFRKKYIALILFVLVILFLPKNIGEGTNLARTASGNNKLVNYQETLYIFKKSPVIGIGFNNLCIARKIYLGEINTDSHACSGSDSSILFILATTGVIGLILFINFILKIPTYPLLSLSFIAVLLHSQFANSLFYPHIMFWLFSLVGLQTKVKSKSN